jgi:hypothetical protein
MGKTKGEIHKVDSAVRRDCIGGYKDLAVITMMHTIAIQKLRVYPCLYGSCSPQLKTVLCVEKRPNFSGRALDDGLYPGCYFSD